MRLRWIFYFFICLSCLLSCQRDGGEALTEKFFHILTKDQLAQVKVFEVDPLSSLLFVTAYKDDHVPVKGSLNIKEGFLDLNTNSKNALSLKMDVASWDSSLVERDERVRGVFFGIQGEDQKFIEIFAKSRGEVTSLLHKKKTISHIGIPLSVTFNGQVQTVEAYLKAFFNDRGRLVVQSTKPSSIPISGFGMSASLKALMALCQHQTIDDKVSVEFYLEFVPI